MKSTQLIALAERYLLARPACPHYAGQIRSRISALADTLGESELSADAINAYLASLESRGLQPETVRGHRTVLLSVLRFDGWHVDGQMIRPVKVRQKEIDCFTLPEIRAMLRAAERMKGRAA